MDSDQSVETPEPVSPGALSNYGANYDAEVPLDLNLFNKPPSDKNKGETASGAELDNQLEVFRQQWQNELQNTAGENVRTQKKQALSESEDLEEQAKAFYLQGMEMEENHMLMEAIYFYKKAMHLVPDIENKLGTILTQSPRDRLRQDSESSMDGSEIDEDLVTHFENLCVDDKSLCHLQYEQRATHISALPVELLMYILQWVVSSALDFRSLENFSQACRGFFLCARDEQIWKMACEKVWGANMGKAKKYGGSWRTMMIERAHPLFDGCYISRMTYIRQGEPNMDQLYRPCHIVQYFRYIRFFADGTVMMYISSDEPAQSLHQLRYKNSRASGLLIGGFRLMDNRVSCVMKRIKSEQTSNYRYKRRRGEISNESDISYYADFEMSSASKRYNAKLTWIRYSTCTFYKATGRETMSNFELNRNTFPSMIFSHVASFCTASTEPLE